MNEISYPEFTVDELADLKNNLKVTAFNVGLKFHSGIKNLINQLDHLISIWEYRYIKLKDWNCQHSGDALFELRKIKILLLCNFDDLPLKLNDKFNEIVIWRLKIGK